VQPIVAKKNGNDKRRIKLRLQMTLNYRSYYLYEYVSDLFRHKIRTVYDRQY